MMLPAPKNMQYFQTTFELIDGFMAFLRDGSQCQTALISAEHSAIRTWLLLSQNFALYSGFFQFFFCFMINLQFVGRKFSVSI